MEFFVGKTHRRRHSENARPAAARRREVNFFFHLGKVQIRDVVGTGQELFQAALKVMELQLQCLIWKDRSIEWYVGGGRIWRDTTVSVHLL